MQWKAEFCELLVVQALREAEFHAYPRMQVVREGMLGSCAGGRGFQEERNQQNQQKEAIVNIIYYADI